MLHVSLRSINGLLATLHQSRDIPGKSNTLPHSDVFRMGNPPAVGQPDVAIFGKWLAAARKQMTFLGVESVEAAALLEKSPPGVRARLRDGMVSWTSAMREVRFGSYSIVFTTAGMPSLSRLKSIIRYICL